jgi:hypothetical protein
LVILPTQVNAAYTGAAFEYEQCDKNDPAIYGSRAPTLQDISRCRADVAAKKNETKAQAIPNQGLFAQPGFLNPQRFSILSWLSLAVNVIIIGVILYWIGLVLKGALTIVSSAGAPDKVAAGLQQIQAVLKSIAAMFIFLLIVILFGNFFGIGSVWQWPESFSQCANYDNKFYFTVRLENPGEPIQCN